MYSPKCRGPWGWYIPPHTFSQFPTTKWVVSPKNIFYNFSTEARNGPRQNNLHRIEQVVFDMTVGELRKKLDLLDADELKVELITQGNWAPVSLDSIELVGSVVLLKDN